jgi:hypothetical protein
MGYLHIRRTATAEPEDLTWQAPEAAIATGQLGPQVLVCNEVVTHTEWWTLDDLRFFHRGSPVRHPPGNRLEAELQAEKQQEEESRRASEQMKAWHRGSLIEEQLRLRALDRIVAAPGVLGATRLFVLPDFGQVRTYTAFGDGRPVLETSCLLHCPTRTLNPASPTVNWPCGLLNGHRAPSGPKAESLGFLGFGVRESWGARSAPRRVGPPV